MTHKLKLLTGLLLICVACSNEKETASGLKFDVLRKGDGVKLDSGKYLILSMVFKDGKDSVWNDTRKSGVPAIIQMQLPVPKGDGVLEAVMMMSKGDSITFKVPAKSLFQNTFRSPMPSSVDSASLFTFNLGLTDVLSAEDFQKFQEKMMAKQNETYERQQAEQLTSDGITIESHLKEKGLNAVTTASGLRYVIIKPGKGENAIAGQSVSINYAGYLLNGTLFDTNIEAVARKNNVFNEGRPYEPYEVVVDASQVITGWHEAIKLMNKGSKMAVYIPSPLAYGNQRRSEEIIENSILMFEMEMVDIK
jgi:FKBP-type peptidyl-prolyl cis-trans isomerase FkpA